MSNSHNDDPIDSARLQKDVAERTLAIINLRDSIRTVLTGNVDIEKKGVVTKFYKLPGELSNLGWVMLDSELISDPSLPEPFDDEDDDLDIPDDDTEEFEEELPSPREENIVFLWRIDGIPADPVNLQGQYAMANIRIIGIDDFFVAHMGYITLDENGRPVIDDSTVETAEVNGLNSRVKMIEVMKDTDNQNAAGIRPDIFDEDDPSNPINRIRTFGNAVRKARNLVNAGILPAENLSLNGVDITDPKVVLGLISKLSPESIEDSETITDFMLSDLFSWLS